MPRTYYFPYTLSKKNVTHISFAKLQKSDDMHIICMSLVTFLVMNQNSLTEYTLPFSEIILKTNSVNGLGVWMGLLVLV